LRPIDRVKERGAKDIRFVCLIAAQQGVERVRGFHPDVRLWTAAIDDQLAPVGLMLSSLYIRRALDLNLFPAVRLDRSVGTSMKAIWSGKNIRLSSNLANPVEQEPTLAGK
jgi:Uracil phosphoribosyltransferase